MQKYRILHVAILYGQYQGPRIIINLWLDSHLDDYQNRNQANNMSIKTLVPPGAVKPANIIQRSRKRIHISITAVVVAKQANGNEVASPNVEIEEGSGELDIASKEENSNDAESREDNCQNRLYSVYQLPVTT